MLKIFLPILLIFSGGMAHEHWLYTESSAYEVGDTLTIHLRSGHNIGESEFLIKTDLIKEAILIHPDGQVSALKFQVKNIEHEARLIVEDSGVYTIFVNLRKRPSGPFIQLLKTAISVGDNPSKGSVPPHQELEILYKQSNLSFRVLSSGEPVKVPVNLLSSKDHNPNLVMDKYGLSKANSELHGFQVAVAHFRRQTATYSFYAGD